MRITRRRFIKLFGEAAVALSALKLISLVPFRPGKEVLRPPGAVTEEYFNRLCVRCGICLEVCPTRTILLANFSDGLEEVDTPKIDPTAGPCEFYRGRCEEIMRCSKFCPTGALQLVDKDEVKIGTVELVSENCLAYVGKECVVCSEMCPVSGAVTITDDLKPIFQGEKCVGCGVCIYYCPAEPKALKLQPNQSRHVQWPK